MRANPTVVFRAPRHVVVEDRPVPVPQNGELLVRTHCTLVSTGTELSVLEGDTPSGETWAEMRAYPYLPGYCNVGTVQAVGPDVDCAWVRKRAVTAGYHGAYAISESKFCWFLPDSVSDEDATFLVLAQIALNGLRRSQLVFGETAVVYGLGLIGQLTVQLCHAAGARPVIGVDTSPARLARLPRRRTILAVNAREQDPTEIVRRATRERMSDVVFELTGNPEVIPQEFRVLRKQGRCVIVSSPSAATLFDFHDLCNRGSYTIIGAHNWSHPPFATLDNPWTMERHSELFAELLASGDLEVQSLISHRIPVEEVPRAYDMLMADRTEALGVLITGWPAGVAEPAQGETC